MNRKREIDKKKEEPVVYVGDFMIPFEYLCEDAWSSWQTYEDISSKIDVREKQARELVKEILTLLPELSEARAKYEESIVKARVRNSMTRNIRVLKSKKILEIGQQSIMARQAEMERINPTPKRINV